MKLEATWESPKEELNKRLSMAKAARTEYENLWRANEATVFSVSQHLGAGIVDSDGGAVVSFSESGDEGPEGLSDVNVNYVLKDIKFLHSQLSSNPPSVVPRPISGDAEDKRAADAADRLVRFGRKKYKIGEKIDACTLHCLVLGTAFAKTMFDPRLGDVIDIDASGELLLEGDFNLTVPNPWNVYPDPDATNWDEVRWVFERIYLSYEEACFLFPDQIETLKASAKLGEAENQGWFGENFQGDMIELYQYWENGLPHNGYQGRFVWCLADGTPLHCICPNPLQAKNRRGFGKAFLPYHILTETDVPNTYWGLSIVTYSSKLQSILNALDSTILDAIKAHGIPRLVVSEGSEVTNVTNSTWDVVKVSGNQPMFFTGPMQIPADVHRFREAMRLGIQDMDGVNEALYGQQSRETSGFLAQFSVQQANMIRRRLFNKYTLFVESIYRTYLNIVKENWTEKRTIRVLGKEKAFESMDIKGADIADGWDLDVEYGASLSLDPLTRREEILTLREVFHGAGITDRTIIEMMKLNNLDSLYDTVELANDRQREIFEEMKATKRYIAPTEEQDHVNMLAYASTYVMTAEFKYLNKEDKDLIRKHIKERKDMAQPATDAAAAPTPEVAPGGGPAAAMASLGDLLG